MVAGVAKYPTRRDQLLVSAAEAKALDEAVGENGWVVDLRGARDGAFPIFVRVEKDQAKVVGYLWTRPEVRTPPR